MSHRYTALLCLAGLFALSTSARAATLTSEFELDSGGIITFEAAPGTNFPITGGTIKVRYNAVGTRTPDTSSTAATILKATISHAEGKIVLTGLPSTKLFVSGGIGSVTLFASVDHNATGTFYNNDFTATIDSFTIFAALPPIASLPASSASLYVYGMGDSTGEGVNTIYLTYGNLPGKEISRTFEPDSEVPMFEAGPALLSAALFLIGVLVVARRAAQPNLP